MQKQIKNKNKKKKIYRGGFQTASIDNFQKYWGGYITASIDKSKTILKPIRSGLKTASIDHITYKCGYRWSLEPVLKTAFIGFSIEAVLKTASIEHSCLLRQYLQRHFWNF